MTAGKPTQQQMPLYSPNCTVVRKPDQADMGNCCSPQKLPKIAPTRSNQMVALPGAAVLQAAHAPKTRMPLPQPDVPSSEICTTCQQLDTSKPDNMTLELNKDGADCSRESAMLEPAGSPNLVDLTTSSATSSASMATPADIVVVDDSTAFCIKLQTLLSKVCRVPIQLFSSIVAARRRLMDHEARLVFLDHIFPEESLRGKELLRELTSDAQFGAPIYIMTGLEEDAVDKSAGNVLAKSVFNLEFVRNLLAKHGLVAPVAAVIPQQKPKSVYDAANFSLIGHIADGAYSKLVLARHEPSDRVFCVKTLLKSDLLDFNQKRCVSREIDILMRVSHPNIVEMESWFANAHRVYMLFSFNPFGDVQHVLDYDGPVELGQAVHVLRQVAAALACLHNFSIAHRDVSAANLTIDMRGSIRLADFGCARRMSRQCKAYTHCGTPEYIAPEVIMNRGHGLRVDMWALGILAFQLLEGVVPFRGRDPFELYSAICSSTRTEMQLAGLPKDHTICRIIDALLRTSPDARTEVSKLETSLAELGNQVTASPVRGTHPLGSSDSLEYCIGSNDEFDPFKDFPSLDTQDVNVTRRSFMGLGSLFGQESMEV